MSNSGKVVKTHYRGTLDDGTQFDSSYDRGEPLEFTCGAGQMIKGFDAAVVDMKVGEKKVVRLNPEDAYGKHNPEAIQSFPTQQVPNADQLPVGQQIVLQGPQGALPAKVVSVDAEKVVLDFNHELAGEALTFEIELIEVAE